MKRKGIVKGGSLKIEFLVFSLVLGFVFSCAKEEEHKHMPDYGVELTQQDGKTLAQPSNDASSLIQQGKFQDLRKNICGSDGCSNELQAYADKPTLNVYITFINSMILFQRLDSALNTLCGIAGSYLGSICGSASSPYHKVEITPKQTDVIDTLLSLVGLRRDEITQLMTEVAIATENYIKKEDKNFVFAITVPFNVKVGNLVNVWFKPGTQIRWDHMNILGAVAQLVLVLFNTINSHNWNLDISKIISNASQLLGDLNNDPAGFIRKLPGTLGIDKAPDFLRFKQGGEDVWKQIPTNISKALTWAGIGAEYFFANPCKDNDPALACWQKGGTSLAIRFNLDTQKENVFMGSKATGVLTLLKGGFSDEMANAVVAILKNGGQKFNCSAQDTWVQVVGGANEFDIQKVVSAVGSLISGFSISVTLPNFARIDFCKLFGVKGSTPLPIRDLLLPAEIQTETDGDGYKIVQAGSQFAIEVEASKNFYLKALTLEGTIYKDELTSVGLGNLYIVTNPPIGLPEGFPYQPSAIVSPSSTTKIYVEGTTPPYTIIVPQEITHQFADFITFAPLLRPNPFFPVGLTDNTVAVIAPKRWVKGDYVARGDGERFEKIKDNSGNSLKLNQDFAEPLTTFVSPFKWHSDYPKDVISSLGAIFSDIGMKFLIYVLFKDPSFNSSLQLDVCIVFYTVTKGLWDKYTSTSDQNVKGVIQYIFYSLKAAQDNRAENWGNCTVIVWDEQEDIPVGISAPTENWLAPTNQLINDLLGWGLFGISTLQVK